VILKVILPKKESHLLQRANYIIDIALKEFIGAKEKHCHDLANWLSYYLYFFSFLIYNYKMECGKVSHDFVTMSQFHNWCDGWSQSQCVT